MSLEQKLVVAALIRGLPYVVIVVSGLIAAARRRSWAAAVVAVGFVAVGAKDIWSMFYPIVARTHTPEQCGILNTRYTVAALVGLYLVSIALAWILLKRKDKPDNNPLEASADGPPPSAQPQ